MVDLCHFILVILFVKVKIVTISDKVGLAMNARSHIFELAVEAWQTEEAILSIFHPVMFHR